MLRRFRFASLLIAIDLTFNTFLVWFFSVWIRKFDIFFIRFKDKGRFRLLFRLLVKLFIQFKHLNRIYSSCRNCFPELLWLFIKPFPYLGCLPRKGHFLGRQVDNLFIFRDLLFSVHHRGNHPMWEKVSILVFSLELAFTVLWEHFFWLRMLLYFLNPIFFITREMDYKVRSFLLHCTWHDCMKVNFIISFFFEDYCI